MGDKGMIAEPLLETESWLSVGETSRGVEVEW